MKKMLVICTICISILLCCTACLGSNPQGFVRTTLPDEMIIGYVSFPKGWYVTKENGWIYVRDELENDMLVEYQKGDYCVAGGGETAIIETDTREYNPYFDEYEKLSSRGITGYSLGANVIAVEFSTKATLGTESNTIEYYMVYFNAYYNSTYKVYLCCVSDEITEETMKQIAQSYTYSENVYF